MLSSALLRPEYGTVAANTLLSELGINKAPVFATSIANALGITIQYIKLKRFSEKISSFYDRRTKVIYVNKDLPLVLQNFSIARDIGHSLIHADDIPSRDYLIRNHQFIYCTDNNFVMQATNFAMTLLVPKESLKDIGGPAVLKKKLKSDPEFIHTLSEWYLVPPRVIELVLNS